MNEQTNSSVGLLIQQRRIELKLSGYELARRAGIQSSTIFRIERGEVQPTAEKLDVLARELQLDPSILLSAAGYERLAELPAFTPYLRNKFPDMPEDVRDDLARAFQRITKKHGFNPTRTGPGPGEDEK